jgi:general stress protein YciG
MKKMTKEEIISQFMSENGKVGGKIGGAKNRENHTHEHFVSIGKMGGRPKKTPVLDK